MKALVSIAVVTLALAGCDRPPDSVGITGPAAPAPAAVGDDSTIRAPGIPDPGNGYGPSIGPLPSTGRFFNYN